MKDTISSQLYTNYSIERWFDISLQTSKNKHEFNSFKTIFA